MSEARQYGGKRARIGLALLVALAGLWLLAASRVYVNASWSDEAWGYAAFPLFGEDPAIGDRVLFDPPGSVNAPVPYLKDRARRARFPSSRSNPTARCGSTGPR